MSTVITIWLADCCITKKEYEKALPYLKRWNELLQDLDGVEPEEKKRRIIRRPMSHSCIAGCLYELSDMEGAEENMKQAIALLEGQKDSRCICSSMQKCCLYGSGIMMR